MPSIHWNILKQYVLIPAALLLLAVTFLHVRLSLELERNKRPHVYDNRYLLPTSDVISASTLNHKTAAADMVWLSGVQSVGASYVAKRAPRDVTRYATTITEIDPYFSKVYTWHSAARIALAGNPQLEDIEAANELLETGLRYFPENWRLHYEVTANYIGFPYASHLDRAKRMEQVKDARDHAIKGSMIEGAPEVLGLLASSFQQKYARMQSGHDENEQVEIELSDEDIDMLSRLYLSTESEHVRSLVESRLEQAGSTEQVAERAREFRREFDGHWRASRLNYLPPSLFNQVDAPATPLTAP
ncbi:MAG: hypothetical protein ACLFVJ_00120 [Persicimonas sp.]